MLDIPTLKVLIDYFQSQFLNNDFFIGFICTGAFGWLAWACRRIPFIIYGVLISKSTVTLEISSDDYMFPYFKRWIASCDFSRLNKQFKLISYCDNAKNSWQNPNIALEEDDEERVAPKISATVGASRYFFKFKGKILKVECGRPEAVIGSGHGMTHKTHETMEIQYLGRSMKTANEIFEDIRNMFNTDIKKSISIKRPSPWGNDWNVLQELAPKKSESLVLKKGQFEGVLSDIQKFIGREGYYESVGVPYHRGYLFYGPPGTGKTSTAFAIASHLRRTVCCLSITKSMGDEDFRSLIGALRISEILVIEDVDCFYDSRNSIGTKNDAGVSFSTFINCMDGFSAKHGSIFILTTNHIEKLDKALIRPGRVDVKVEMTECDEYQLKKMFSKFYPGTMRSEVFCSLVGKGRLTPAQIQGYLMTCDGEESALANVGKICDGARETRTNEKFALV